MSQFLLRPSEFSPGLRGSLSPLAVLSKYAAGSADLKRLNNIRQQTARIKLPSIGIVILRTGAKKLISRSEKKQCQITS